MCACVCACASNRTRHTFVFFSMLQIILSAKRKWAICTKWKFKRIINMIHICGHLQRLLLPQTLPQTEFFEPFLLLNFKRHHFRFIVFCKYFFFFVGVVVVVVAGFLLFLSCFMYSLAGLLVFYWHSGITRMKTFEFKQFRLSIY